MMTAPTVPDLVTLETHIVSGPEGWLRAVMLAFLYRILRVVGISVSLSLAIAGSAAFFGASP